MAKINPYKVAAQSYETEVPEASKKGKRSDPAWIARTFYIKKETDLDTEAALFKLRRDGKNPPMDKSELVDWLLGEWLKSQDVNP